MILLIDGYNLLKQIFPGVKHNLDKQRSYFINQLAYYKSKKGDQIREIIVVFDAGPSTHAVRSIKSGIVIVFSGIKSSADNWIVDFVERNRGKEILVVTMDKDLREACQKLGADWLNVYEFYTILQEYLLGDAVKIFDQDNKGSDNYIKKFEHDDNEELEAKNLDSKALDLLMEEASIRMNYDKDVDAREPEDKRGKAHTPSKKEKRIQAKLKKLE